MTDVQTRPDRPALRPQFPFGLSRLLAPIDVPAFTRDSLERRPLIVSRQDPRYYDEILSLDDMDAVLSTSFARPDALRVVENGQATPGPEGPHALETLYDRYRHGSTVIVNSMQEVWEPLKRMCTWLAVEGSCRVQVNAHLT